MTLPRKTRTPAMRLRDELRRISTEDLIRSIKTSAERGYGEYARSGRAEEDRRKRRQMEREEQRRKKRHGKDRREQEQDR